MTFSEKYVRAAGVVESAGRWVKRYHISTAGGHVPCGIRDAAYTVLPELLPKPDRETPPGGWAILHKGDGVPAYLIAYSWTWSNVVECRAAAAGIPELGCDDENPENFKILDRPWAGCVWELAPLGHERAAWVRHVLRPQTPDLDAYLADVMPDGSTEGNGWRSMLDPGSPPSR
jgi:hypothetical protein